MYAVNRVIIYIRYDSMVHTYPSSEHRDYIELYPKALQPVFPGLEIFVTDKLDGAMRVYNDFPQRVLAILAEKSRIHTILPEPLKCKYVSVGSGELSIVKVASYLLEMKKILVVCSLDPLSDEAVNQILSKVKNKLKNRWPYLEKVKYFFEREEALLFLEQRFPEVAVLLTDDKLFAQKVEHDYPYPYGKFDIYPLRFLEFLSQQNSS